MRNLALHSLVSTHVGDAAQGFGRLSVTAHDLDNGVMFAIDERVAGEQVYLTIWRIDADSGVEKIASHTSPIYKSPTDYNILQVAALHLLPDERNLVLVTRGGDIATVPVDEPAPIVEVVGSIEDGILGAAWSPDDTVLALVTGAGKLLLMTPSFDVLSEAPLQTSDFGADAPINVGWGSKQTQFHGSLGKAAAQASSTPVHAVGSSPDDDGLPRVSWRTDAAFFAVSSLEGNSAATNTESPKTRRVLRVYDRTGALQSTGEALAGLEHSLAWRPAGTGGSAQLLASTQRFGYPGGGVGRAGRHDIVFFERNGLRHGEFGLRIKSTGSSLGKDGRDWSYKVKELAWSADATVLAVWIEAETNDYVQLWTIGNYHWYLKHEVAATSVSANENRFTSIAWHPEEPLKLILTTFYHIVERTYVLESWSSPTTPPIDSGMVAVVDGVSLLLTPFRTQNIPPPMASHTLSLNTPEESTPVHVALSSERDVLVVLYETGRISLWELCTRLGPGSGKVVDPNLIWEGEIPNTLGRVFTSWRQITIKASGDAWKITILGSASNGEIVKRIIIPPREDYDEQEFILPSRNGRLVAGSENDTIWWEESNGEISAVDIDAGLLSPLCQIPEFCHQIFVILPSLPVVTGLSRSGKLYVATSSHCHPLATGVNSFTTASGFIIYTTTAHEVHFASISTIVDALISGEAEIKWPTWESRRVERGSRIVTAVPSAMALVLQMPRGNLETINPRPLVMEVVRKDIDAGDYRKAFIACRKHRIDLNVLIEHNPDGFINRLSSFVDQVNDVDYLNLFLTNLGRSSQPPEKIAALCDVVRLELEKRDTKRFIQPILTAHVIKTPPDLEAGLTVLLRLRESDPEVVEEAVKYIIFLAEADKLFDTALGMYDFSLVLLIAQHAQKDPREYLPFLRSLRALDPVYQRFTIDAHLKRHSSALRHLRDAGHSRFSEAKEYLVKWHLYEDALLLWRGREGYEDILGLYGEDLFERREFGQAALVFTLAAHPQKALVAYERALQWEDLFDLAEREKISKHEVQEIAHRISEELIAKKRHNDAGHVLLDYGNDVRSAIIALVDGGLFSEARRIATRHAPDSDFLVEIIHPGALERKSTIIEEVDEVQTLLDKQTGRIRELRAKRAEDANAYWGIHDAPLIADVDVMTDASGITAFTRYTAAPSAISRTSSKRTSRSKRKLERKSEGGRKGTADEEEYLLKQLTKLVMRFDVLHADTHALLPHLAQFTEEHRNEAIELRTRTTSLKDALRSAIEEAWTAPLVPEMGEQSWEARITAAQRVEPTTRVPRPEIKTHGAEWGSPLVSVIKP